MPVETARIARASYPKGNVYLKMRDELGTVYDDAAFAHMFPNNGQPAEAPWRLALVTVMQFVEGLSDRQAADAESQSLGLEICACDTKLHEMSGKCCHFLRSVSGDLSPLPRASRVSSGYEAGGNAQEASEPSPRLRSREDGQGERERILDEVSSFQHAGWWLTKTASRAKGVVRL